MEASRIEIRYKRAKFGRRLLANMIDFVLFVIIGILLFMATRAIVNTNSSYHDKMSRYQELQLESGLYVKSDDKILDLIVNCEANDTDSPLRVRKCEKAIIQFVNFFEANGTKEDHDLLVKTIKDKALSDEYVNSDGVKWFIYDETSDSIIKNQACTKVPSTIRYDKFYKPVVQDICKSFLVKKVVEYHDLTSYISIMLLALEIPVAYLLSGILVYFVPTLFFRKGRKTLGKAIYHIGLVDNRLLNPSFGRSLARFSIFYFAELILCLFTFGIPLLVSFSLMVFSKNKQGFPDYMLGLHEVDTSDNDIYDTYDDITISEVKHDKTPVDFQMTRNL